MKKITEAIKQIEELKERNQSFTTFYKRFGSESEHSHGLTAVYQNEKCLKILKTIKEKDDE